MRLGQPTTKSVSGRVPHAGAEQGDRTGQANVHVERGRRLLRDQRYEEAVRACDAALELVPDQPLPMGAGQVRGTYGDDVVSLKRMKGFQRFRQLF